MVLLRKVVDLAVPASVAVIAFLHAHAIGSLVDAVAAPSAVLPFAEARAAAATAPASSSTRSARTILAHNPFDHTALPEEPTPVLEDVDPLDAPPCDGVRAMVSVRAEDSAASFAALRVTSVENGAREADGQRLLRRPGGNIDADRRVVYVGADRVWIERGGKLCVARVFADPPPPAPPVAPPQQSATEKEITSHIVRTGPNEFQIDRGSVDRILEAPAELMKTPMVTEKEGDRVVGFRLVRVRPGSVLSAMGIESGDRLVSLNGIEVASTERMMEAYARLRTGTIDRVTINVVRSGKPLNIDYAVR